VSADLLDHAIRLLEHEPTRCMTGDALYQRTRQDTGMRLSLGGFLATLEQRPDRFAVVRAGPARADAVGWHAEELSVYRAALARAGLSDCFVTLAERPADSGFSVQPGPHAAAGSFLADVHGSITHVLSASHANDDLRSAAVDAVYELERLRRGIG
jgi:hypothetical protein